MRRIWTATGLLAGAALAVTCAVYDSSLLLPADAGAPDAGADAGSEAGPGDDGGCALARPPGRPAGADGPDGPRIVMAVDSLRLDDDSATDAGIAVADGYDVDGVCTCPGPESCKAPAQTSSTAAKARCDGDGGRDNAAGKLFTTFAKLSSTFQPSRLRDGIRKGNTSMVFVLTRYNGAPDDPSVTVSLYLSPGFEGRRLDGGVGDAGESSPLFDGTDRWTISPTSLIGGATLVGTDCETATTCAPLYVDSDAYVAGGTLVAHLDFPIGVSDRFVLLVSSATVTGQLLRQGAGARLERGQVAGRAAASNILSGMGLLQDPFSSDYLCKNNPTYLNVKQTLCASADVAADPRADNTGAPCDALAAAVAFSASPARLGVVLEEAPAPTTCPGWRDQCP